MRAAQLSAPNEARIVEIEPPRPAAGEVVLKVLACGVCGSDLNAWRGAPGLAYPLPPGAPGHEVYGEVDALGPGVSDGRIEPGGRVTGLVQNGYAELAVAKAEELVAVPESFGSAPLLGEPLACAANVVRRAGHRAGEPVAVVGFGYLAALIVQLLLPERDGRWVAISRRPESRDLALALGATAAHPFEAVPDNLWDSFPLVIEAAGVQQALDYATWLTAYGGRLTIAGYHADGPRTVNMQSWNWKGIDVINAHERRPEAYLRGLWEGLTTIERHGIDLSGMISHRWPLGRIADAFRAADERPPDYVKGVVLPWGQ